MTTNDPIASSQRGGTVAENAPAEGVLFILVGPAGVGKSTIMTRVMAALPQVRQLPTMTTRPMRPTEQQGREHYFVTVEEFRSLIGNQALIEYQEVYPGTFYGMPRQIMQDSLNAQKKMIADIEVVGAGKIKAAYPDHVVLIFVAPPSLDALEKRLRQRGHMSEEEISKRLDRASFELGYPDQYDYRIINDTLEHSVEAVTGIIRDELARRGCAQPSSES
jgi:guanylate kinase